MTLYYTLVRLPRVIERLKQAGWTVTQKAEHQSDQIKSFTATRSRGSIVEIYWTQGRAPLFNFHAASSADARDAIFDDVLRVRKAMRFA